MPSFLINILAYLTPSLYPLYYFSITDFDYVIHFSQLAAIMILAGSISTLRLDAALLSCDEQIQSKILATASIILAILCGPIIVYVAIIVFGLGIDWYNASLIVIFYSTHLTIRNYINKYYSNLILSQYNFLAFNIIYFNIHLTILNHESSSQVIIGSGLMFMISFLLICAVFTNVQNYIIIVGKKSNFIFFGTVNVAITTFSSNFFFLFIDKLLPDQQAASFLLALRLILTPLNMIGNTLSHRFVSQLKNANHNKVVCYYILRSVGIWTMLYVGILIVSFNVGTFSSNIQIAVSAACILAVTGFSRLPAVSISQYANVVNRPELGTLWQVFNFILIVVVYALSSHIGVNLFQFSVLFTTVNLLSYAVLLIWFYMISRREGVL